MVHGQKIKEKSKYIRREVNKEKISVNKKERSYRRR
jgi:hypothetical protein